MAILAMRPTGVSPEDYGPECRDETALRRMGKMPMPLTYGPPGFVPVGSNCRVSVLS
jgi:hypothetical protein